MAIKTVLLFRHAKSSWSNLHLDDHDRPLNERGRKAAKRMAKLLHTESLIPDCILCSTSIRTRQTAELFGEQLGKFPPVEYLPELYHAEPSALVRLISKIAGPVDRVMLIGHNPGFEEFLEQQTGEIHPFPTAALARIEYEMETWADIRTVGKGRLVSLWTPKGLVEE